MNKRIFHLLLLILFAVFLMGIKYGKEYIGADDFHDSGFFNSYVNFAAVDGFKYALFQSEIPLGRYKNVSSLISPINPAAVLAT